MFIIGIYLFISLKQRPYKEESKKGINITPTIIDQTIKVIKTLPSNNQKYVLDDQIIEITFNRNLNDNEKNSIEIIFNPTIDFEKVWEKNTLLKIKNLTSYKTSTKYTISVFYNKETIYNFSFYTNPLSINQLNQQTKQLVEDAITVGEAQKKTDKEYPWNKKLPIVKEEYSIVYSFEQNAFRIKLNNQNISSEEKQNILNKALNDLEAIGVDTKNIKYFVI